MKKNNTSQEKNADKNNNDENLYEVVQEAKEIIETFLLKEKRYMSRAKIQHKLIFAFVVFFAINLVWYGMWDIISDLPILSNPIVAIITGSIILIVTGYFYENMISIDFSKTSKKNRKKKPSEKKANK